MTKRVLGPQFHSSKEPIEEIMRAPAIHVGTRDDAEELSRYRSKTEKGYKTHVLGFSKHAQFHDVTLSDGAANEAHSRFLEEKGLTPTKSVHDSRLTPFELLYENHNPESALAALKENKILRYVNSGESGDGSISYVVPSPHMNLRRQGHKDPMEQPVLPMDYSGINPSDRTKWETKGIRKNVWR